jgi:uncharacterized protein YbjQ (UPF0145 family)
MNWIVSCAKCGNSYVYESGQGLPEMCSLCSNKEKKDGKKISERGEKRKEIVSISTSEFKNRKIVKTLGIVSHEHIFGIHLNGIDPKKVNRGTLLWTEKVNHGRELSIRAIEDKTVELGGNAVVGVDITYNVLGTHQDMAMMLVAAKGTAVVVE